MLSTNRHIFRVNFQNITESFIFQNWSEFKSIIGGGRIVKNIQIFDNSKGRFYRTSKENLLRLTSWNTEVNQLLSEIL